MTIQISRGFRLVLALLLVGAGAGLAGGACAAPAASAAPLPLAKVQALIAGASKGRAQAQSVFAGPGGLTGAVVSYKDAPGAPPSIIWINGDASALLVGKLVGPKGEDLDKEAEQRVGLLLSPEKAIVEAADPARGVIRMGRKGPVLTVFLDPNCIYCHLLYEKLQEPLAQGKLRVRYVVVAVVKQSSLQKAAAILGARDPAAALALDQEKFDAKTEEGGVKADTAPSKALVARINANSALMAKAGGDGTPTLLYCSKSGGVQMLDGMPRDLDQLLAQMASGPEPACGS